MESLSAITPKHLFVSLRQSIANDLNYNLGQECFFTLHEILANLLFKPNCDAKFCLRKNIQIYIYFKLLSQDVNFYLCGC